MFFHSFHNSQPTSTMAPRPALCNIHTLPTIEVVDAPIGVRNWLTFSSAAEALGKNVGENLHG